MSSSFAPQIPQKFVRASLATKQRFVGLRKRWNIREAQFAGRDSRNESLRSMSSRRRQSREMIVTVNWQMMIHLVATNRSPRIRRTRRAFKDPDNCKRKRLVQLYTSLSVEKTFLRFISGYLISRLYSYRNIISNYPYISRALVNSLEKLHFPCILKFLVCVCVCVRVHTNGKINEFRVHQGALSLSLSLNVSLI